MTTVESGGEIAVTTSAPRPQRADARRNCDALMLAARTAFTEKGTQASMEEIARRAGVGIGTLYRHFPTREALIERVYADEVDAVIRTAGEVASLQPWQALTAWLERFIAYVGTKRALIDGLNRESATYRCALDNLYEAGRPLLERAQAAGDVRPDTTIDDIVRMVVGLAGGIFPEPGQRERVMAMALDGVRAR